MNRVKSGELASSSGLTSQSLAKLPKLPLFDESKVCNDSYLQIFERFASCAKWDKSSWAMNFSALLTGKALEVYSRLPVAEALKYESLKRALLKRFQLTEEGFRLKFRSSRSENGENPLQFFARLDNYVEKWFSSAGSPKSYENIKDLFLKEQILNSCSNQLGMYLKERHLNTVEEMSNMADQFIEAHGYSSFVKDFQVFQKQNPNTVVSEALAVELARGSNHQLHHSRTTTEGVTFVIEMDIWQKAVIINKKFRAHLLLCAAARKQQLYRILMTVI